MAKSAHYLVQLKRGAYIHRKTYMHGTPEYHEKRESLAQQIFPHLQYLMFTNRSTSDTEPRNGRVTNFKTTFLLTVLCMWVQQMHIL